MSVECVGFSKGSFRWAASGGMDKTLKVRSSYSSPCPPFLTVPFPLLYSLSTPSLHSLLLIYSSLLLLLLKNPSLTSLLSTTFSHSPPRCGTSPQAHAAPSALTETLLCPSSGMTLSPSSPLLLSIT